MDQPPAETNEDVNALENPEPDEIINGDSSKGSTSASSSPSQPVNNKRKKNIGERVRGLITHLNIYLLLFILILVMAGGIIFIGIQRGKKDSQTAALQTQPLTQAALDKIKGTNAKVGDPKQTLSIESNTVFSGKVLLRDSLDVAGTLKVGGPLSLTGLNVSGSSTFNQIQGNSLSITGDTNIQGNLKVQKTINVTGGASFGGPITAPQITVQNFQLSGDLQFNRHIAAGGGTPGHSNGVALGAGGTASVSGSDTAGTVTMNIGGGPGVGCFITVYFTQNFNSTPHIAITPVGSAAAGLNFYITRTSSNFTICSTNPASAGTSFSFDYIALD